MLWLRTCSPVYLKTLSFTWVGCKFRKSEFFFLLDFENIKLLVREDVEPNVKESGKLGLKINPNRALNTAALR